MHLIYPGDMSVDWGDPPRGPAMPKRQRIDPHTFALHWNTAYPVGIAVDLREDDGRITRTVTRSAAWVMGGHSAVVMVEGRSGGYDLTRITAVQPERSHA